MRLIRSLSQIAEQQLLQQLVPVDAGDEAARAVVVGDIGGVLGENIADELVDGVVALYQQRVVYRRQNLLDLGLVVDGREADRCVFQSRALL